ncbi:hypothetical protein B0H19DRAFT_1250574 [Mycena capillaripes]|nr:hypothetical protein B0H19DRAFT_1250574 [Mycena capillaripes]
MDTSRYYIFRLSLHPGPVYIILNRKEESLVDMQALGLLGLHGEPAEPEQIVRKINPAVHGNYRRAAASGLSLNHKSGAYLVDCVETTQLAALIQ